MRRHHPTRRVVAAPAAASRDYTGRTTSGGWCHVSVCLRRAAASALVSGVIASGLLAGLAGPAAADVPPADPPSHGVELAATGAGDRALIGLGVVGGVLLIGGAVAIAVTPRRSSDH